MAPGTCRDRSSWSGMAQKKERRHRHASAVSRLASCSSVSVSLLSYRAYRVRCAQATASTSTGACTTGTGGVADISGRVSREHRSFAHSPCRPSGCSSLCSGRSRRRGRDWGWRPSQGCGERWRKQGGTGRGTSELHSNEHSRCRKVCCNHASSVSPPCTAPLRTQHLG